MTPAATEALARATEAARLRGPETKARKAAEAAEARRLKKEAEAAEAAAAAEAKEQRRAAKLTALEALVTTQRELLELTRGRSVVPREISAPQVHAETRDPVGSMIADGLLKARSGGENESRGGARLGTVSQSSLENASQEADDDDPFAGIASRRELGRGRPARTRR